MTEIGYTHGYCRELSPALLSFALLDSRMVARTGLRYLELGFGQGLSFNIHAAACAGEFWGTDFFPAHTANAIEMAEAAGSGARVSGQSFADLAARDDLPEFDVIALQGVWSWISDENRAVIIDLVNRKLAVGGVLYTGYNCTPGWSPTMPLRHLLHLHTVLCGTIGRGVTGRIDDALNFAQQIVDSKALYFQANPAVASWLKTISGQSRNYLAHEYFNQEWQPMPFSRVAELLGGARLDFATSANLLDHVDAVNLTEECRKLLLTVEHPMLRESVRDYMVNAQFRKDIFIKGGRAMSELEQNERYQAQGFVLVTNPADIPMKIQGALGDLLLREDLYGPLIEVLADNSCAPTTLAELISAPSMRGRSRHQIVEALVILVGAGHVHPTQDAEAIRQAQPQCNSLNNYLCRKARFSNDSNYLASPVIGGGVEADQFQQLFLTARKSGKRQPEEWARHAWDSLNVQNRRLMKDGKPIETAEEKLAELEAQARVFAAKRLPVLKALGVTV
ncbi:MAG: class I SAM-dependent methyltransferase [Desulfuromonadales bacterium]